MNFVTICLLGCLLGAGLVLTASRKLDAGANGDLWRATGVVGAVLLFGHTALLAAKYVAYLVSIF